MDVLVEQDYAIKFCVRLKENTVETIFIAVRDVWERGFRSVYD